MERFWKFAERTATLSMIVVAVALIWSIRTRPRNVGVAESRLSISSAVDAENLNISVDTRDEISPNASIAIVEYSDYLCPFCRRHSQATLPSVRQMFVNSGRVAYLFRNMPLIAKHPEASWAAELAECGRVQGQFWGLHDALFKNQSSIKTTLSDASSLGLNSSILERCVENGDTRALVESDIVQGARLGVDMTPSFLIGIVSPDKTSISVRRRIIGAQPFDVFKTELETFLDLPKLPIP